MKYFFMALIITILLQGCSVKNAFSKLEISNEQEKAVENTRSGKMQYGEKVGGIFSVMYLNDIYPSMNRNTNYFYISVYTKDKNEDLIILSNGQKPLKIKSLPHNNKFTRLLPMQSEWAKNYLVSFDNNEKEGVNISIESGQFSSGQLNYSTD